MTRAAPYYTPSDVVTRMAQLGRTDIKLVRYAGKAYLPSTWFCTIHGTRWEARARNIFAGHGCPDCARTKVIIAAVARERNLRRRVTGDALRDQIEAMRDPLPVGANS